MYMNRMKKMRKSRNACVCGQKAFVYVKLVDEKIDFLLLFTVICYKIT